jgi:ureidoglycolate hydrolase
MIQFLTPYILNTSLASLIPQTLRYHTYNDELFHFHYISKTVKTFPTGDRGIWHVYTDIWMDRSPPTIDMYIDHPISFQSFDQATPVGKGDHHPLIIIVNPDSTYHQPNTASRRVYLADGLDGNSRVYPYNIPVTWRGMIRFITSWLFKWDPPL